MRVIVALLLLGACGKKDETPKAPADTGPPPVDAEPEPALVPPPRLEKIDGASAAAGKALFVAQCASCHGEDGKGNGPKAEGLRIAPTDLTTVRYLCRSTIGQPLAIPSDVDIETAIDRGTHKGAFTLDAAQRRSLMLYLKTLSVDFNLTPEALSYVPDEPPDGAESRARGRTLYLAFGCWRCHGADGSGGGDAVATLRFNDRPIASLIPLSEQDKYLCGDAPERVFRTLSLGLGTPASIMPTYQNFAEQMARPDKGTPAEWTKALSGKIPEPDLKAVQSFYEAQPPHAEVRTMTPAQRRKRGGAFLWDLVHYVRSL